MIAPANRFRVLGPALALAIASVVVVSASAQTTTTNNNKKTTTSTPPPPPPRPAPPPPRPAPPPPPPRPTPPPPPPRPTPTPPRPAPAPAAPHPEPSRPAPTTTLRPEPKPASPPEHGAPVKGPALTQPTPERSGPEHGAPVRGVPVEQPKPGRGEPEHGAPERGVPERRAPIAQPRPNGFRDVGFKNGGAVRMRPDGRPADLHDPKRGIDIHHNLRGGRQIVVERKDHSRVFIERGRPGYIERSYGFHGHDFARRTYVDHGRTYQRFYGSYGFHGVHLAVYAPARYYAPGFYGWAYHPYVRPAPYTWGFTTAPWYHPYAVYFAPAPVYPGPSLWLSDYLLSASLAADYQAQVELGQAAALDDPSPITDDVRQEIGDEVQEQIALENSEAVQNSQGQDIDPGSSSIARLLSDGKQHVLVAGEEVDVVDSNGQECAVTEGDVVQIGTAPAPNASSASAVLLASKGGRDCKRGAVVSIPMDALQEMQNHMREVIDQGLAELQAKQGAGMIPAAPPAANASAPPVTAAFAAIAPPPDPSAAEDIAKEEKDADKSEKDLLKEAAKGSSEN